MFQVRIHGRGGQGVVTAAAAAYRLLTRNAGRPVTVSASRRDEGHAQAD
jgi:Pyruvate/2-oxoacid:ferredoxin oxidoreductase gamma subunit